MFTVERQIEIDAGHRVPDHHSKCKHLHGHRYRIVAVMAGHHVVNAQEHRSDSGMVRDFGDIKRVLMEQIHDKFDHKLILWDQDPLLDPDIWAGDGHLFDAFERVGISAGLVQIPVIPTAECLAEYWSSLVAPLLTQDDHWLYALDVHETPNCKATYYVQSFDTRGDNAEKR